MDRAHHHVQNSRADDQIVLDRNRQAGKGVTAVGRNQGFVGLPQQVQAGEFNLDARVIVASIGLALFADNKALNKSIKS
jgi:hypothetical protein